MECLNKVELKGFVGNTRVSRLADTRCVRFSVATNHCFTSKEGENVIETTWHQVLAWENPQVINVDKITRGSMVHVLGRIRVNRYTDAYGSERQSVEILANSVEIIDQKS